MGTTVVFPYTGARQTFVVPAGVTSIRVECRGAAGNQFSNGNGGKGGVIVADRAVTPGEVLYVRVGGRGGDRSQTDARAAGGWNGGGRGGLRNPGDTNAWNGGGGGGASDVRLAGDSPAADLFIGAGGGGGTGNSTPGGHGGPAGANGGRASGGDDSSPGSGGTNSSAGGSGAGGVSEGGVETIGYWAQAGSGRSSDVSDGLLTRRCGGGGGGGGFFAGGGAGRGHGGGGGANIARLSGTSLISSTAGTAGGGDGLVVITYNRAPGIPGEFTAPVSGSVWSGAHTITWGAATDPDGDAVTYDLELSTDNGASWTRIATGLAGTSRVHDFSNVPATTAARLVVRAVDPHGVVSDWRMSTTFEIRHNRPPTAPTELTPSSGSLNRAVTQRLGWRFNDPDPGDGQSQADVQWRLEGATDWTLVTVTTANWRWDAPPGTFPAGKIEWRVRTYDKQGVPSPWSSTVFFTAANVPPGPTIIAPTSGAIIATESGVIAWSYPTQEGYEVRIVADNNGVPDTTDARYSSGPRLTEAATVARDHPLTFPVNGRHEHLQVRIRENGLWSGWASSRHLVDYATPATPAVDVDLDPVAGALVLHFDNPDPTGSEPVVTHHQVRRRIGPDGPAIRLAHPSTGQPVIVPAGGSWTDHYVANGVDYHYQAVSVGENGTTSLSPWSTELIPSGFTTEFDSPDFA